MRRLAKCVALVSPGPHAIFLILSCDDAKNEQFDMKKIVTAAFGKEYFFFSYKYIQNSTFLFSNISVTVTDFYF